jgi:hypothetical protein
MKIKVKIDGHQFYDEIEGTALWWGQTVETFKDRVLEVPCVLVQTKESVVVVPLKEENYEHRIEIIED